MRKYIIGGLVGAALTFSVTAYGEDLSKIGAKVQGEYMVVVDGQALPQKAVGIDGSTYAPLRAIGEELGYDVSFANKTVTFTAQGVSNTVNSQIEELQKQAGILNQQGVELQRKLANNPENKEQIMQQYDDLMKQADDIKKQIDALKAQAGQ